MTRYLNAGDRSEKVGYEIIHVILQGYAKENQTEKKTEKNIAGQHTKCDYSVLTVAETDRLATAHERCL